MSNSHDEFALHLLSQAYNGMGDYTHAMETEEKALALFRSLRPGQKKAAQRETLERALNRYRQELQKHGAKQ